LFKTYLPHSRPWFNIEHVTFQFTFLSFICNVSKPNVAVIKPRDVFACCLYMQSCVHRVSQNKVEHFISILHRVGLHHTHAESLCNTSTVLINCNWSNNNQSYLVQGEITFFSFAREQQQFAMACFGWKVRPQISSFHGGPRIPCDTMRPWTPHFCLPSGT